MIYRVLVLLFAIVMIAAGTERMCAEVCCDPVADILDEDAVIHVDHVVAVSPGPSVVQTTQRADGIAPAPVLMRVFRPPRIERV